MIAAWKECSFPPVARCNDLQRLEAFSPTRDHEEFWTQMHEVVQEQFSVLETEVRQLVPGVQVAAGCTRGEHFMLFTFRKFWMPNSEVDPVVAGMTFTSRDEGVHIEADVSGEQTGDYISSASIRIVRTLGDELLVEANQMAKRLQESAEAIAVAISDPTREVD
jgi:hypothetical protein